MFSRSTGTLAAALGLLATTGCLHPVTEKVDATVCSIAARPRDLDPERAAGEPAPLMLPSQSAVPTAEAITPVVYSQSTSQPPPAGRDAAGQGGTANAPAATAPMPNRLTIPPGLPGANAPPLALPPLTPENEAKRRDVISKLYPQIEPLGPDPKPEPGPDGRPYTLADLQRLGLTNSPLLRQAAANVEAARGAAIQAGAYPNPQVGFEQDTIYTAGGPGYVGGFVDQKIIMGSKLQLARAAATMDFKNAELALRRAETDLMARIRGGYYAVLVAQENERISRDLAKFTTDIYQIQVDQVNKGGIAAPYEPLQLRALAIQARASLVSARNRYTSAWKQLVAALGLPGLPPTELAGRVDAALPVFDHDFVLNYALRHHTDVLTAENAFIKSQYSLRLARQTVVPDVDVRVMLQKDTTGTPFNVDPSVQVYFPLPVWDRNEGGIIQAQGNAVNASEEAHRVRSDLTTRLADAFERYSTNRVLLGYYRDQILPDLVRAYRGLYLRYQTEMAPGVALPGAIAPPAAATTPPAFADVVVGQQNLAAAVVTYVQTLGQAWQAVVDVADVLQTDDIYRLGNEVFPTECPAPLPDIGTLPPLPCGHPCSPLPDPALKGADGEWPAADSSVEPKRVPAALEKQKQSTKKAEPGALPALTKEAPLAAIKDMRTVKWPTQAVSPPEEEPSPGTTEKLLEPPPDLPRR
jgi:cobalt-zinc-cadmium efflux system outer membrane protein